MYNHNKAQQSKNHVHISWDILYMYNDLSMMQVRNFSLGYYVRYNYFSCSKYHNIAVVCFVVILSKNHGSYSATMTVIPALCSRDYPGKVGITLVISSHDKR